MSREEDIIDQNEDKVDEEGCESCGAPLYPFTVEFDDGRVDKCYLRCTNSECKELNKLIEV
jgi:hypothetical protein